MDSAFEAGRLTYVASRSVRATTLLAADRRLSSGYTLAARCDFRASIAKILQGTLPLRCIRVTREALSSPSAIYLEDVGFTSTHASELPFPFATRWSIAFRLFLELQLLMARLFTDNAVPNGKAAHVLIIVVGKNEDPNENLPKAREFALEIAAFWEHTARFPNNQKIASIEAVVSDPGRPRGSPSIEAATLTNCRTAILNWARLISQTAGVGVLHWIGHGLERREKGDLVSLLVEGRSSDNPGSGQAGLDWTRVLNTINMITRDLPVFCFMDACRHLDKSAPASEGLEDTIAPDRSKALVFWSCMSGKDSFWLNSATSELLNAGGGAQAVATRAFLSALESFGALGFHGARLLPIRPLQVKQGSTALLRRWLKHQGLLNASSYETVGPRQSYVGPILVTKNATSVVDVIGLAPPGAKDCDAINIDSLKTDSSETSPAPFEFRLRRNQHRFSFDGNTPGPPQRISNPHKTF